MKWHEGHPAANTGKYEMKNQMNDTDIVGAANMTGCNRSPRGGADNIELECQACEVGYINITNKNDTNLIVE